MNQSTSLQTLKYEIHTILPQGSYFSHENNEPYSCGKTVWLSYLSCSDVYTLRTETSWEPAEVSLSKQYWTEPEAEQIKQSIVTYMYVFTDTSTTSAVDSGVQYIPYSAKFTWFLTVKFLQVHVHMRTRFKNRNIYCTKRCLSQGGLSQIDPKALKWL